MAATQPSPDAPGIVALHRTVSYRIAWLITAAIVGLLYFWLIGIGEKRQRFVWRDAGNDYYNLLGRAFAGGKLSLPVEPAPELLALRDPWDERANQKYALQDAVLFNKHYYLYHGPTPALVLFTPWYAVTRHDLPDNFAAFLLCLGGYLFLAELFFQFICSLSLRCPLALFSLLLLALGMDTSVPFLLHRVAVYEIAIACGYFWLTAGCYFAFKRLTASGGRVLWSMLSGLSVGLAVGCRPHLGVAAVPLFVIFLLLPNPSGRLLRRDLLAFSMPVIGCCLGILAYNFARFGDPLEFGLRYQLAGASYRNVHLSCANVIPGLYYLLLCPPDLVAEFPFFRLALRQPFDAALSVLPPRYFIEPIGGILTLCPIVLLAPVALVWRTRFSNRHPVAMLLSAMFVYAAASILFIATTGLSSQRFEIDFLPFLLLVACVGACTITDYLGHWSRVFAMLAIVSVTIYCLAANLALAIQGPYDQFVQASPHSYVKLARWFSPVARFRPRLNPKLHLRASFEFRDPCPPGREPLVSMGEFGSRYAVSAECIGDARVRIISEMSITSPDANIAEVPLGSSGWKHLGLEFTPNDLMMTVAWNDTVVLRHRLRYLVTAPSQVHFGWDPSLGNKKTFDGRIRAWPPAVFGGVLRNE